MSLGVQSGKTTLGITHCVHKSVWRSLSIEEYYVFAFLHYGTHLTRHVWQVSEIPDCRDAPKCLCIWCHHRRYPHRGHHPPAKPSKWPFLIQFTPFVQSLWQSVANLNYSVHCLVFSIHFIIIIFVFFFSPFHTLSNLYSGLMQSREINRLLMIIR